MTITDNRLGCWRFGPMPRMPLRVSNGDYTLCSADVQHFCPLFRFSLGEVPLSSHSFPCDSSNRLARRDRRRGENDFDGERPLRFAVSVSHQLSDRDIPSRGQGASSLSDGDSGDARREGNEVKDQDGSGLATFWHS